LFEKRRCAKRRKNSTPFAENVLEHSALQLTCWFFHSVWRVQRGNGLHSLNLHWSIAD